MTERKFALMSERKLGVLNPDQRKAWKRLMARQNRIAATSSLLEEDMSMFFDSLVANVTMDNHSAVRGLKVKEDGSYVQTYCECFQCQAKLQNLPASQVVESMIQMKLIEGDVIQRARQWAKHVEKMHGVPFAN